MTTTGLEGHDQEGRGGGQEGHGGGQEGHGLTFSHTILFKDQKKSREKVEQLNGRLRARFGCRAIRATAFSSPVARPLCVPNSRQSGQWSANTAARAATTCTTSAGKVWLAGCSGVCRAVARSCKSRTAAGASSPSKRRNPS